MVSRLYLGRPLELGCRTGSPTTRSLISAAAVKPPIQGGASTAYKASPMASLTYSDAHLSTRKICSTTETSSRTRIPGIAKVKRISSAAPSCRDHKAVRVANNIHLRPASIDLQQLK
jgi:hypothetical protein